jgi:hypothetical protein
MENGNGCIPSFEPCMPGYIQSNDICIPCPIGTRSDGWIRCLECEAGSFNPTKIASTRCETCPVGKAGIGCSKCEAGNYAPMTGLTACIKCDSLVWNEGIECHPPKCIKNLEYWYPGLPKCQRCTECLDTTYAIQRCNETSDTICVDCTNDCPPYHALTQYCTMEKDSVCTLNAPCPNGMQKNEMDGICIKCPIGKYGMNESCKECNDEEGLFPNAAQTECVNKCESGAYLTINQESTRNFSSSFYCSLCAPGTGNCKLCPENTYSARFGQIQCLPCPFGTWSLPGSSACSSSHLNTCFKI